jgi:mannose-6-phosphate isomerase-like protein (cupin superfamily)
MSDTEATIDAARLMAWVAEYEHAWRAPGTDLLDRLFTEDATYLVTPYEPEVVGLPAIRVFWDDERDGPEEVFTMSAEPVACSGDTGVVRVHVRYGEPVVQEYLDLWVVRFGADGRAMRFEEWPFWPAHGRAPARSDEVVVARGDVPSGRWNEWVRTVTLSSGVYRIPAGGVDDQSPHAQDEVYVVTAGRAELDVEGRRSPVGPGTVAFVPRRVEHRFVEISEDLEVAVVFAPPESELPESAD